MNVLVVCEYSGAVRDAFRRRGHHAVSCDLLPTDVPGPHFQGDATWLLYPELSRMALGEITPGEALAKLRAQYKNRPFFKLLYRSWLELLGRAPASFSEADRAVLGTRWDLVVAHPPCTFLCSSGLHWNRRRAGRDAKTADALRFVRLIRSAPVARICLENPVGKIGTAITPATQYVQPYEYGHDASKTTGLWLIGLPPLRPTIYVPPRVTETGQNRWANQTEGGQDNTPNTADRWKVRSETYAGIAEAMAEQWSRPFLMQGSLF